MAIIDDRTTNLNLPLPNIGNKLVDDVARLRTAFSSVDTAVALKAVAATTYSKAQVDTAIAGATPSFSTLTGKPTTVAGFGITDVMTATTAQAALDLKANQATTYTKIESDTRIQSVVGAAPLALDTLVEIAAQLASDESAAAALVTTVSGKVDKVTGKGLSTEDYTSTEKTKLAAVTGANTGDETLATIKAKLLITTLSGVNTGDQVIPTTLPASDVSAWAKSATKPAYTATEVGLALVNNTTDAAKPVSTATQTALDLKAPQGTTYTKTEADDRIQAIIGAAPLALDTLVEIAAQLASDESAAAALVTTVSGKVDKVTGKSLSAEDFSTVEKTKLAAVTGANTGDETLATIKTKLGVTTLSGSNTGDQTTISGNAGTATKLASVVNINGVAFDGSAAITINAVDTTARVASSLLGAVSGVATLDANGKLTAAQATQNTSLVGLTFTTPSIIVASGSVVLTLSGTSTLVGGVIDRFEVTDWNSALTTVVAASNAGSKTLTATATIGQVLSISVVAIDSYGNRSAPIARTITVVVRAVNAMSITSPANNATGIGQAPVISGNSFSVNGGADTQVSADWEVWTGAGRTGTLVWSSINDTVNKTSITMPLSPILASSTVYYIAARYKGTTLGYGGYGYSSFTTVAVFVPTTVGTAYQGGFYAGKIKVGTLVYALVVSPKSSGDIDVIYGYTPTGTGQTSMSDGLANSLAGAGYGPISPIRGMTIGGYVDWYLPAKDELEILYRNLKYSIAANSVTGTNGLNTNSIPVGNAYSLSNPTISVSTAFAGGVESFTPAVYWTSTTTATPSATQWVMTMHNGSQWECGKTTLTNRCRAVRRVLL